MGSVKRGLTGAKKDSTDEFLVKKKDPLILPPDFENLPTPDERATAEKLISIFEENLEISTQEDSSSSSSVENSILKWVSQNDCTGINLLRTANLLRTIK